MKDKYKTLICCCCGVLIFYSIIKLISDKSFEIVCGNYKSRLMKYSKEIKNEIMQNRY